MFVLKIIVETIMVQLSLMVYQTIVPFFFLKGQLKKLKYTHTQASTMGLNPRPLITKRIGIPARLNS